MIADAILAAAGGDPVHNSGSMPIDTLRLLERLVRGGVDLSVETGCGASTVIFSNYAKHHIAFAFDDRHRPDGSARLAVANPAFRPEPVEWVFGATQSQLPPYRFPRPIDFALIDGPHGFPFPQLEYYFLYPHLRKGTGILAVDDIQIPIITQLYEFLLEDAMFELIAVEGTLACFRRTEAETFDPRGDGWSRQGYNAARAPKDVPSFLAGLMQRGTAPRTAAVTLGLGKALLRSGDQDAAEHALLVAARTDPALADVYRQLGLSCFRRRDFAQAAGLMARATRLEPSADEWLAELASLAIRAGDWQVARDAAEALGGRDPHAADMLALALKAQGDDEAAEAAWGSAEPAPAPLPAAPYRPGQWMVFGTAGTARPYLRGGWWPDESWGTWSRGIRCDLEFGLLDEAGGAPGRYRLDVVAGTAGFDEWPVTDVDIVVNGVAAASWHLDFRQQGRRPFDLTAELPAARFGDAAPTALSFRLTRPISRRILELKLQSDPRMLGLGIRRLRLDPLP